ncbi:Exocyst complex component Exo70 [Sesbania bispinosa]|nr:Exocyst complex component Exo70 [Sesbania bispinosa]
MHLERVVKHLLEIEYILFSNVFEKIGPEAWTAIESGILSFLEFEKNVTRSKNGPFKLLKLLDIFRVLNGLRLNFNQLFNGKACEEIRTLTKDLINKVFNGASDIFWQLPLHKGSH